MRGFDKLEEGRSRVLVYQVGSIQIIYQDVIRWLYQVDCQMDPYQILVDSFISQWMLVESIGSMCILVGSMCILVDPCISQLDPCISQLDLSWIHVYPVGSLYILVEPLQTLVYPLLDPCRSLQIFSISTCIFIYPLYPYQSTLIHSYPPYPSILYLLISILCNRSILPSSSRHY